MNKSQGNIVMWILLCLLAAGLIVFAFSDSANIFANTDTSTEPTNDPDGELAVWIDAVNANGSVVCDFKDVPAGEDRPNLYVSEGRFSQTDGERNMVVIDGKTYMWVTGRSHGQVTNGNLILDTYNSLSNQDRSLQSIDEVIQSDEIKCEQQSIAENKFIIPENIEFQNI